MSDNQTLIFYVCIIIVSSILIFLSELNGGRSVEINYAGKKLCSFKSARSMILKTIALIVVIFPLSFRSMKCGADTYMYYSLYRNNTDISYDTFFWLFLKMMEKIISDPYIGLGIVSAITIIVSYVGLWRMRNNASLSLMFLCYMTCIYFYSYNYIRMMLAVAFVLVGYTYAIENNRKMTILFFLIASAIHLSAGIVLLAYIAIVYISKYKKLITLIILLCVIVFIKFPTFFLSLISIERYKGFISSDYSQASIGIGTFIKILPIIIIIIRYNKKFKKQKVWNLFLIFTFLNFAISILGYYVAVATRLGNVMFVMHLIYIVPWIVRKIKRSREKKILSIIYICYCFILFEMLSQNFVTMGIMPYK